jgi:hypothetical protein
MSFGGETSPEFERYQSSLGYVLTQGHAKDACWQSDLEHPYQGWTKCINSVCGDAETMDLGEIPGWLFRPPIRRTT